MKKRSVVLETPEQLFMHLECTERAQRSNEASARGMKVTARAIDLAHPP